MFPVWTVTYLPGLYRGQPNVALHLTIALRIALPDGSDLI
jgi:hypothetical protein